jgi:hypothetical protein
MNFRELNRKEISCDIKYNDYTALKDIRSSYNIRIIKYNGLSKINNLFFKNIPLLISSNSNLEDPNVRISLYKKAEVGPYNQIYTKIDLNEYSVDQFTLAEDFAYYVEDNDFVLSLNVSSMDKTGYELRFELYSGDTYIYTIKKKFILR